MSQIRHHQKSGNIENKSKRAAAKGRLHTWMRVREIVGMCEGYFLYRCLVCDFYSWAKGSRTPEPEEPYCA